MDEISFDCPRCGSATVARFYGPCSSCTGELRTMFAGEAKAVEAPEYEPKMNVTPNAIATKE